MQKTDSITAKCLYCNALDMISYTLFAAYPKYIVDTVIAYGHYAVTQIKKDEGRWIQRHACRHSQELGK